MKEKSRERILSFVTSSFVVCWVLQKILVRILTNLTALGGRPGRPWRPPCPGRKGRSEMWLPTENRNGERAWNSRNIICKIFFAWRKPPTGSRDLRAFCKNRRGPKTEAKWALFSDLRPFCQSSLFLWSLIEESRGAIDLSKERFLSHLESISAQSVTWTVSNCRARGCYWYAKLIPIVSEVDHLNDS